MLIKENNHIYFSNEALENISEIPVANWLVVKHDWRGLCLVEKAAFELPGRFYGDVVEVTTRYLSRFNQSEGSLGILLSGYKGQGKSLLAKLVSVRSGLPVLIIAEYFPGTELLNFLSSITQPVVVFFDEFEKRYDTEEKQNDALNILDGFFGSKKLFIITSNTAKLNQFLINRPGRIFYHKEFDNLDMETIQEVVEDKLENKDNAKELITLTKTLGQISIDSLISLIDEMNMFKESPREAFKHLNIDVEAGRYAVTIIIKGKHYKSEYSGHPLGTPEYTLEYPSGDWWRNETYKVVLQNMTIEPGENGRIKLINYNDQPQTSIYFDRIKTATFNL